jgi:hypothetical protein
MYGKPSHAEQVSFCHPGRSGILLPLSGEISDERFAAADGAKKSLRVDPSSPPLALRLARDDKEGRL